MSVVVVGRIGATGFGSYNTKNSKSGSRRNTSSVARLSFITVLATTLRTFVRVHAGRVDAELGGAAHDAAGDLAAVGRQQLAKGRRGHALGAGGGRRARGVFVGRVKGVELRGSRDGAVIWLMLRFPTGPIERVGRRERRSTTSAGSWRSRNDERCGAPPSGDRDGTWWYDYSGGDKQT